MQDMTHERIQSLLEEYAGGRLSSEEEAQIATHIQTCPECAELLECPEGEALPEEEPLEPELPRPGIGERLLSFFRSLISPQTAATRGVAAGAVILLLGVVGFVISEIDGGPTPAGNRPPPESGEVMVMPAHGIPPVRNSTLRMGRIPKDDGGSTPTEGSAIFAPESRESEHNESSDDESYRTMKGPPADFLASLRGEAGGLRGREAARPAGAYDTLEVGAGGGGGGRYGGRLGGRSDPSPLREPEYFKPGLEMTRGRDVSASVSRRAADQVEPGRRDPLRPADAAPQDESGAPERKIIRTGEMEFEVDSFESTVSTLTKITLEEQGFIATVNSEKLPNGKVRGTAVVRVPPERLDTLLLKLRALGDLKSQRIGSEDVTRQFTDLESRLRAARTMEERLLAIIKEGKGQIKDLLQAEKELGEWRTRVESLMGEIRYFSNRIAHSTLTLTLYEKEIRAPWALLQSERVEMAVEVEDVEKAHRDAQEAVTQAKGRITHSELKQLGAGQFSALIHLEISPAQSGPLRDRFKQLGVLARLDVQRTSETQGGFGKPQEPKIQESDTRILLSLYNLTNLAPRETVHLTLASADAEQAYQAILDRVQKADGRILSSRLARPKSDQTTGTLLFHVRSAEGDAVLRDLRAVGEVMRLEITEDPDTANATRSKRGFDVTVQALSLALARESATVTLASREVARSYRELLQAIGSTGGRVLSAQLDENDRKRVTAELSIEIPRKDEGKLQEAMSKAGDLYTRTSIRSPAQDGFVDSKLLFHFKLFDSANIPPRETVKIALHVGDVEASAAAIESLFKDRVVGADHNRESSGQRESLFSIDLPLSELKAAVERLRLQGEVRSQSASKNASIPDSPLAVGRLEVRVSDEILISHESGPVASLKRGLAISLQAGSWALMLVMIGICFVGPLGGMIWVGVRIRRKLRSSSPPAAPAA